LPIADCRLAIADCGLPIGDCRLRIADFTRASNRQLAIGNRQSQIDPLFDFFIRLLE